MICQKRARQTRQHFVGRNHLLANFIAMAFQATHVRVCLKCNWNLVGKTNWNCCIMQKAIKPQTERPLQLGGWKWMVKRETTIDFNAIFYFSKIPTCSIKPLAFFKHLKVALVPQKLNTYIYRKGLENIKSDRPQTQSPFDSVPFDSLRCERAMANRQINKQSRAVLWLSARLWLLQRCVCI